MSLKTMHTVFIALSCIFAILFAAWSWREWTHGGAAAWAVVSISSATSAFALLAYGARFIHKTRGLA